jgi:hypothetical protein
VGRTHIKKLRLTRGKSIVCIKNKTFSHKLIHDTCGCTPSGCVLEAHNPCAWRSRTLATREEHIADQLVEVGVRARPPGGAARWSGGRSGSARRSRVGALVRQPRQAGKRCAPLGWQEFLISTHTGHGLLIRNRREYNHKCRESTCVKRSCS